MFPRTTIRLLLTILLVSALAVSLFVADLKAEVKLIRSYRLHQPRDRGVLFEVAITPEQDVLLFVAKEIVKLKLSRVRGWLEEHPTDQTIDVPGWSKDDDYAHMEMPRAHLLVTPDGRYAVCVASVFWRAPDGRAGGGRFDDILTVVDLHEFRVVNAVHSPVLPSEIREFYLDSAGRLVLLILEPSPPGPPGPPTVINREGKLVMGKPRMEEHRLLILSLPELVITNQCSYSKEFPSGSLSQHDVVQCNSLLTYQQSGSLPLAAYLAELKNSRGKWVKDITSDPTKRRLCGGVVALTPDGRFKWESCQDVHRNWWGNPKLYARWGNFFSVKTGKQLGTLRETTHDSVDACLSEQNGRDYMLVVEGGGKLKVYEIKD